MKHRQNLFTDKTLMPLKKRLKIVGVNVIFVPRRITVYILNATITMLFVSFVWGRLLHETIQRCMNLFVSLYYEQRGTITETQCRSSQ